MKFFYLFLNYIFFEKSNCFQTVSFASIISKTGFSYSFSNEKNALLLLAMQLVRWRLRANSGAEICITQPGVLPLQRKIRAPIFQYSSRFFELFAKQ
jgi:hypothetical protein